MTAPWPITRAVQEGVDISRSTVSDWLYDVLNVTFESYKRNDEHCPNRPGWDVARDDLYIRVLDTLETQVYGLLITTMVKELTAFAKAHPDAPRNLTPAIATTE